MTEVVQQSRTPTWSEAIGDAIDAFLDNVHTALPGRIETYDATTQKATVKPMLKRPVMDQDGNRFDESLPVLTEVPVAFPRGGGFFMTFPLKKGDLVLLIFCERAIENFTESSGTKEAEIGDLRRHDLSDAVALPCFYPFVRALKGGASTTDAVFGKEMGPQVRVKPSTIEVTSGGATAATGGFVAMATVLLSVFNSHTHSCPSGGGTSGPPAPLMTTTVASTNLKAD